MLPSQSIYVWLQAERPSLAQPGNPVLSLSKHAWSPRPALRQAHVWTAPAVQEEFGVCREVGCKSCIRPVATALKTAGHDVIRRIGSQSGQRADGRRACHGFSLPHARPLHVTPSSPSQFEERTHHLLTHPLAKPF